MFAVTQTMSWHVPGPPTREGNSGAEQNRNPFGLCCPNRRRNRSAFVCLFPNRPFWSAFCWPAPSSDDGVGTCPLHGLATQRPRAPAA